jgi:hypothetical protein
MEETPRTVRLAESAPFDVSTRGVTATLLRADIEAARSGAGPAELVLDVRRDHGADVQAHSIVVEWSPADLERLLEEGEAEEVTIAFDRDEMAAVMDAEADVEAHGLREKALVLTVVAVTGLSTAGIAQARPTAEPLGTAASVATAPAAQAPASTQAPAADIGGAMTAGAVDQASPATTIGGAATKAPEVIQAAAAAPATTTGGATAAQAPAPSVSPATTMGGAGAPPVTHTGGPIASTGSGSSLSTGEEAALAAGAAGIMIAAAGFAAAGRRRRPIQPA